MSGPAPSKLVLGTRGSDLALTQARMVEAALIGIGATPEIRIVKTIGDKRPDLKLSEFSQGDNPVVDKGIFTKELEEALLRGEIDAAVHSLKDVPTELADEFHITATLPRAPIEDVVISKREGWVGGPTLSGQNGGGTAATSSVRRARQLRWLRPDLEVADIRGNVPTRIRKLIENDAWDAILLARAGLERLGIVSGDGGFDFEGRTVFAQTLDAKVFLPAAGQGAIAIESLKSNAAAIAAFARINHPETFERVTAERAFLARLQAGCQTPVGAHTWFEEDGGVLAMRVRVFDEDDPQAEPKEAEAKLPAGRPEPLADLIFEKIHGQET